MKKPTVFHEELNHNEEEDDSKWDVSLCFSNSEIILLYSIEENNDISFKTLRRNQVLNSEILNEEVYVSFANSHEHSLHGFPEEQFDRVVEKLQLE